jgi:DNA sulfur modification protein DndC
MTKRQISLFENQRLDLEGAINLSLNSLRAYGQQYHHWVVAYSGGKDSSATVAFVAWAIKNSEVIPPASLTVLYADTRQELPPLQQSAMRLLGDLKQDGITTQVVTPALDDRYFVYMLGRGVPPPNNMTLRWCTPQLKIEPMHAALNELRQQTGQKLLMLTGVRLGESAARDQRIALSCSKDSGECGQGWMQVHTPEAVADTLAPLLHWRLCHIFDWLYFDNRHGYDVSGIVTIYGESDVRTGCIGCPLASDDTALKRLLKQPEWSHLAPLQELRPLYRELRLARNRKRKSQPERRKDGKLAKNVQRLGPLTMEARAYGLGRVLDIQARAGVDLINAEEEARIRELWAMNTWPQKWDGSEVTGDQPIDAMRLTSAGEIAVQSLLVR